MNDKHKNCPQEADKDRRGKAQENADREIDSADYFQQSLNNISENGWITAPVRLSEHSLICFYRRKTFNRRILLFVLQDTSLSAIESHSKNLIFVCNFMNEKFTFSLSQEICQLTGISHWHSTNKQQEAVYQVQPTQQRFSVAHFCSKKRVLLLEMTFVQSPNFSLNLCIHLLGHSSNWKIDAGSRNSNEELLAQICSLLYIVPYQELFPVGSELCMCTPDIIELNPRQGQ